MIDQIGGWARVGIGAGYGEGYSQAAIKKIFETVSVLTCLDYFSLGQANANSIAFATNPSAAMFKFSGFCSIYFIIIRRI